MTVYVSTLVPGLARAEMLPGGQWVVEVVALQALTLDLNSHVSDTMQTQAAKVMDDLLG